MNDWDREFEVDAEAVRRVAAPAHGWRLLASGWDCDAWLADEAVVWRVPRRRVGIAALEREARVMPHLAPRLPAPVSVATLVRAEGLPPLARHAFVPGREFADEPRTSEALAAAMGTFLRALHAAPAAHSLEGLLPVDPMGRADPAKRIAITRGRLDQIAELEDVAPLRAIVDAAAGPALITDVVCHGDLHIRHVVVDRDGGLAGVIDWGDCCVGSPAMDLGVVTAFDRPARAAFFDAYGAVGDSVLRHARMLGVMFGAVLLAADPQGASGRGARRWLQRLREDA